MNQNKRVQLNIESEIIVDDRVESDNVVISVSDGEVKLEGHVPSFTARRAAEEAAWSVIEVKNVINNIEVNFTEANLPTDKMIRERIENKFLWDSDLKGYKLNVEVDSRIASLSGTVNALWKKDWAQRIAESTFGVILIKNAIAVVPTSETTDEVIADEISESLARKLSKPEVESIDISVRNNVVSFTGKVPYHSTWKIIMDTARNITGVVKVMDKLSIVSNV